MLLALYSQGGVILVVLSHFILHTGPRGTCESTDKNSIYLWQYTQCQAASVHFLISS